MCVSSYIHSLETITDSSPYRINSKQLSCKTCAVLSIKAQPLKMLQTPLPLGFLLSLESSNQPWLFQSSPVIATVTLSVSETQSHGFSLEFPSFITCPLFSRPFAVLLCSFSGC